MPKLIGFGIQPGTNLEVILVVVAAIKLTIVWKLRSGFPHQV